MVHSIKILYTINQYVTEQMNYINRLFIWGILCSLLALAPAAKAQKVSIDNYQHLRVEFVTGTMHVAETDLDGQTYNTLAIDGYMASTEVGQPCLPTYSTLVEVPLCSGFDVVVSDAEYDTLDASALGLKHRLLPLQPSRHKSDTAHHAPVVGSAYGTDAFYGVTLAQVEPVGVARDRNLARLQFSPVRYNPVSGRLVVCRRATVDVRYTGADPEATQELFNRYHSPAFSGAPVLNSLYPKSAQTTSPIRYLIVAHSMFREKLDEFVLWKRRKGFLVDIAYTDSAAVGTTTTSIQAFIQSQYTNATASNPAPTYLLLVGDYEQIPAFDGTTSNEHITDLYYTTWTTGDHIPDCYHGRFSAQTITQLQPQVLKTIMYEKYTFADPSFLDRAVMVAGVDQGNTSDHGYSHADPAMDYAIQHYINGEHGFSQVRYFKNKTSVVPTGSNVTVAGNSSSMSATVRSYYNEGAGWVNYSAHGSSNGWATPEFNVSQANSMTNTQKFGLFIGNCCQTNTFENTTCFGEALLRKGNYCGAVGYIGGSDYTYWGEDFYWAVGMRSSISASMSLDYDANNLGAYDRLCHTHGEAQPEWVATQGGLMFEGNMAVESSTSSLKHYYWEIYHLMGDPSLMPYLTQAPEAPITLASDLTLGDDSLTVTTVPYAYVALTDSASHTLVGFAYADSTGLAQLVLTTFLTPGNTYELVVSVQQHRTTFHTFTLPMPDGVYVSQMAPAGALDAGATLPLAVTVTSTAVGTTHGIVLRLASNNPSLTLSADSLVIDSLAAGATLLINSAVSVHVGYGAVDGATAAISATADWNGCQQPIATNFPFLLQAPQLTLALEGDTDLPPAADGIVSVTLSNIGHTATPAGHLLLVSPTLLLTATAADTTAFSLAAGSTVTRQFIVHADSTIPQNTLIPTRLFLLEAPVLLDTAIEMFIGLHNIETFEGGQFHLNSWSQGTYNWIFDDTTTYAGNRSLRSTNTLTHNQTAQVTITHTFATADSIIFHYKVSSESNYDKFHFYIDNSEELTKSGSIEWTRAAFAVDAGSHTFKFSYSKDGSVSRDNDCAWIDNLIFPTPIQPVSLQHDTVCYGADYVLFGDTVDTWQSGASVRQGTEDNVTTIVDYYVLPAIAVTVSDTVDGDSYTWNGNTYTASGEYVQTFTSAYGCDSTVTLLLTFLNSNGINGVETSSLKLYPNPTTGNVQFSQPVDEVRVYDALGRQVTMLRDVRQMNLAGLPQGVYTLRASTPQGTATLRLILK